MDHRIPRAGLAIGVVMALLAVLTFAFLNERFEGPSVSSVVLDQGYEVTATFKDTEILPPKQPVLHKGVSVGRVRSIEYNKGETTGTITFVVDDDFAPLYNDASVQIGERSLLGDPFLNLDPGHERAGELENGGAVKAVPSVDFDEAFDFLDEDGRAHVRSIIDTLSDGTKTKGNGAQLNSTIGGLNRTVTELRILTDQLRGQEAGIASFVSDASVVVTEIGDRETSLRSLVAGGRVTLDAVAANTASLEQGLAELPPLLAAGRSALANSRPLLENARPLIADLRDLAPDAIPALKAIGPLSRKSAAVIEGLEPQRIAAEPVLPQLLKVSRESLPVVQGFAPASRNLVPTLDYVAPRANSFSAFFANLASATAHGDSLSRWARFHFTFEPGEQSDVPTPSVCQPEDDIAPNAGFCQNAYPEPNDALNPEPFNGTYPRLLPFTPPPRR